MDVGTRLLTSFSLARNSARIAAPFVKAHTLERVLEAIPDAVPVTCITRWRPEDIASGVCDLEIFNLLKERGNAVLFVQPHLHAKFFAADDLCLIGSANLTHSALGWRSPSNKELLVELDANQHKLNQWWDGLLAISIAATREMTDALARHAHALKSSGAPLDHPEFVPPNSAPDVIWAPECPRWSGLWEAYIGDDEKMPASTMRSAQADLLQLCLPPGLDEADFKAALAAVIRGTDIFQRIEQLSSEGLTDEAGHKLLCSFCGVPEKDAPRRWDQIKAWLSALYPNEYRVETNQEVLLRGRTF